MKKLLLILFTTTAFISCSKDHNSSSIPDGTFQFKVNGNLIKMNGNKLESHEFAVFTKRLKGSNYLEATSYMFNGSKDLENIFDFGIPTDSLNTQTYICDSTTRTSGNVCWMKFKGQESTIYYDGDNLTIDITSYSKGFISGKFSGKFTPSGTSGLKYSDRGTTIITEGEFKNIRCNY